MSDRLLPRPSFLSCDRPLLPRYVPLLGLPSSLLKVFLILLLEQVYLSLFYSLKISQSL